MMKRLLCLIAACALLFLTASALAEAQPTAMEILVFPSGLSKIPEKPITV